MICYYKRDVSNIPFLMYKQFMIFKLTMFPNFLFHEMLLVLDYIHHTQDLSSRDEEAGKTPPRVKSGDLTNISEGGDANEATATKPSKVAFQEEVFVVEDEAQEMSDGEVDLEQAWQVRGYNRGRVC